MRIKKQESSIKNKVEKTVSSGVKKSSSKEPQTMEELLTQTGYKFKSYKRGDPVTGTIISVSPNEILIDIGAKSYAQVGHKDLENIKDLIKTMKVGDSITGLVMFPENELGYMVISLRNLGYEKRWETLAEKLDKDEEIEVRGLDIARGGVLIDYAGIRGFIPASQLDTTTVSDPIKLKGKRIKVKILELNKKNTRLVVSQKAVTQKDLIKKQKEALDKFEVGKKYEAVVTGVAPFGIFVVVPVGKEGVEIEGLVHISEIAWEKVENPQKYVKTGERIEVVVIGIDKATGRLNLSKKQLTPDPWKEIAKKYKVDQQV
ncbi:MAG: S1 RNA-binding domain-containing protein, partial [Actinobacteria bacterium]|nr:S1 RNA-binding domain-containing protein [Actinomycetota bacterium]